MITIGTKIVDGVICPASEFPVSAIKIVCDGTNYTVYEQGDELPPEPVYEQ
jgi:hypothetical protein